MRALTQCKLAGTRSFRLATAQPFGFGVNSQNSDKDTIDIYEAPQGYSIVQPDQSGAEALVVAHLAEDGKYRELFREASNLTSMLRFIYSSTSFVALSHEIVTGSNGRASSKTCRSGRSSKSGSRKNPNSSTISARKLGTPRIIEWAHGPSWTVP